MGDRGRAGIRTLRADRRGASITLNYVLTISIATLLVTGLLVAGGNFVDRERDQVARNELSVVGQRVVADIERVDRLAAAGTDASVELNESLPTAAVGNRYELTLNESSRPELVLRTAGADVTVRIPISNRTPVDGATVNSGDISIVYADTDGDSTKEITLDDS